MRGHVNTRPRVVVVVVVALSRRAPPTVSVFLPGSPTGWVVGCDLTKFFNLGLVLRFCFWCVYVSILFIINNYLLKVKHASQTKAIVNNLKRLLLMTEGHLRLEWGPVLGTQLVQMVFTSGLFFPPVHNTVESI